MTDHADIRRTDAARNYSYAAPPGERSGTMWYVLGAAVLAVIVLLAMFGSSGEPVDPAAPGAAVPGTAVIESAPPPAVLPPADGAAPPAVIPPAEGAAPPAEVAPPSGMGEQAVPPAAEPVPGAAGQ